MPIDQDELAVSLEQGVLTTIINGQCMVIDTGCPSSLGVNETIDVLGRSVFLNSSLMGYPWSRIQESFRFPVSGLIGVDAFSDSTVCLDIGGGSLKLSHLPVQGESVEFLMGSPTVHCSVSGSIQNSIIDTGAKLCYAADREVIRGGDFAGIAEDFHPLLGAFEVETYELSIGLFGYDIVERVAVAPERLALQLSAMNIGAVVGTNLISRGVLTIDFQRQCVAFDL